jgi:succinate dehydrogenase/fumarate reductase flavoprotein subunit
MEDEAITYLRRNQALQPTPIERLEHMNPLAVEIYSEHGIDIRTEPLEINVCAQHHNGGFVVDKWWQSSVPGTFVIGEMAGTHGVKRPGGSALNAGQVGGLRSAEYIANACDAGSVPNQPTPDAARVVYDFHKKLNTVVSRGSGVAPHEAISAIQHNMSLYGGHIRELVASRSAQEKANNLYRKLRAGEVKIENRADLIAAVRAEHLALTQAAFLAAIVEYIESGGGSRGSFIVLGDGGAAIHPDLLNPATKRPFAFVPENEDLRKTIAEVEVASLDECMFRIARVPVRPIPERDDPFELAWAAFRSGEAYRK